MKVALDTSVIIRLLTGDDLDKQARARRLLESAGRGEVELVVPPTAIADAVFVLSSPRLYDLDRATTAELVLGFLMLPGVATTDFDRTQRALALYAANNLDFGDAFLAAFALELDSAAVYSFDRDFDRVEGLARLEP